jgi:antitoxin component HigA of HigAB toxin-antitoxin module
MIKINNDIEYSNALQELLLFDEQDEDTPQYMDLCFAIREYEQHNPTPKKDKGETIFKPEE